jgi:hypothetical protein
MTTKRRIGKVIVSERNILNWLGYDGGRVSHIGQSEDFLGIFVIVEHPDMPEMKPGMHYMIVTAPYYSLSGLRIPTRPWRARLFNILIALLKKVSQHA